MQFMCYLTTRTKKVHSMSLDQTTTFRLRTFFEVFPDELERQVTRARGPTAQWQQRTLQNSLSTSFSDASSSARLPIDSYTSAV